MIEEIERRMRDDGIVALNILQIGGRFSVHIRASMSDGFTCAQKTHGSLADAIREHLPSSTLDLSDLLV